MFKQKTKTPTFISRGLLLVVSLAVLAVGITPFVVRQETVLAATNGTINFQARLLTAAGNVVPDGVYNVEFKIYNAATSTGSSQGSCTGDTACKWTETRINTDKVTVKNGYLTVNLGSVTAFGAGINWDQELWLTMNIGGTGSPAWDGEMNPRLKLTSVPYAFRSGAVVSADGTGVLIAGNGESGTICVQNSVNCGFVQGDATDFIQNTTSPQTANINITSSLGTSTAMTIQGANSASVPVAIIKGGATPGSAADILQLQDSTGASMFKVDNNGDATIARSLTIDYASGVTNQLNIQGPSGQFVTVNSASNKFHIGDQADCSGRFCVAQNGSGTGGASYTNSYNSSIFNYSTASTIINQDIKITDTSSSVNHLIRGIRIDSSASTNSSATLNSFQILIPSTSSVGLYGGNAIQVQNGSTNIFRITNTGQATFQSVNNTNTAFRILNSSGTAMFTLNTNGTDNGIYVAGDGTNGAGGRIFFGATGNSGVWVGEEGSTDSNVLALNGSSGLKVLVGSGQTVATFSATGELNLQPTTNSTQIFSVKNAGGNNLLTVDADNSRVGINLGSNTTPLLASTGLQVHGALRLSSDTTDVFTTPTGSNVGTKINIPVFDPGSYGQILAMGLGASTQNTARGISLFDARTTAHQPTLSVFNPSESDAFGLSWDGSNTTAYLKSLSGQIGIRPGGNDAATFSSTGIDLLQHTAIAGGKNFTIGAGGTLRTTTIDAGAGGEIINIGGANALGINLNENTSITGTANSNTLTVSNGTTTGNIAAFRDELTDVVTIADGGAFRLQNSVDSRFAFTVKNQAGTGVMRIDTVSRKIAIGSYDGTDADNITGQLDILPAHDNRIGLSIKGFSPTYNSRYIQVQNSAGSDIFFLQADGNIQTASGVFMSNAQSGAGVNSNSASFKTGDVSGAGSSSGTATFKSGDSTTSGNTGGVNLTSGNATSGNSGSITIDVGTASATTGTIYIGTSNASTVAIGNSTKNSNISMDSGTGSIMIGTGDQARSISIGTGAAAQTLTLGSQNTTSATTVNSGTGGTTVNTTGGFTANTGTSGATFKSANTATAFRVLNASDVPLFAIDSSTDRVYIGNPTDDAIGALLVLDSKNTIADPSGVPGGMYYNSVLGRMRCYEMGRWTDCTSSNLGHDILDLTDDFITGLNIAQGTIGSLNWVTNNNYPYADDHGEANHPGIITQSSSAVQNTIGRLLLATTNSASASPNFSSVIADDANYIAAIVRPNSGTGSMSFRFGLTATPSGTGGGESSQGIYWSYHSGSSANWRTVTRNTGNITVNTTSTAYTAGNWYRLEIRKNSSGNWEFYMNGTLQFTHSTNIPGGSTPLTPWFAIETNEAVSKTIDIDWFRFQSDILNR